MPKNSIGLPLRIKRQIYFMHDKLIAFHTVYTSIYCKKMCFIYVLKPNISLLRRMQRSLDLKPKKHLF